MNFHHGDSRNNEKCGTAWRAIKAQFREKCGEPLGELEPEDFRTKNSVLSDRTANSVVSFLMFPY
jgi:hypothetical protein